MGCERKWKIIKDQDIFLNGISIIVKLITFYGIFFKTFLRLIIILQEPILSS